VSASVLIADDDPNIVRALRFLMHRQGLDVRTAGDGETALAAIEETPPDLVLLDLMMPKGSGYEVCRALRANRSYDDVKIVMLTAKGSESDQRIGMDLGADAYITKPFAIDDVVRCVADVLARRRTTQAASRGSDHPQSTKPQT
jgi:two-component system, OmpR family, alkaline phosphatase synthesis response regulator PhoP